VTRTERRHRLVRSLDRLEADFGVPRLGRHLPALDELVLTILSQNTNDRNRDRAYASLRRRFPAWKQVLRADRGEIEAAIRVGGLSRVKSGIIQEALRRVKKDQGRLTLSCLTRMPLEEARRYLRSFKGVGEKTANCVLLFSCGHAAFPVDTHIHRVARRLGWVPAAASPDRSHGILADLVPSRRYLTAHVNLITLGRRYCHAGTPECHRCPLESLCPHAARPTPSRTPRRRGGAGAREPHPNG
jgi:endonuclease III